MIFDRERELIGLERAEEVLRYNEQRESESLLVVIAVSSFASHTVEIQRAQCGGTTEREVLDRKERSQKEKGNRGTVTQLSLISKWTGLYEKGEHHRSTERRGSIPVIFL